MRYAILVADKKFGGFGTPKPAPKPSEKKSKRGPKPKEAEEK